MVLHIGALPWVGGVAFDNRAVQALDKGADEAGFKVAFGAIFAGRDLDTDLRRAALGDVYTECLVDANQALWG